MYSILITFIRICKVNTMTSVLVYKYSPLGSIVLALTESCVITTRSTPSVTLCFLNLNIYNHRP